ncbi:MAG: carbonic anhydrase, partial [Actinomycetota bacterium]
MSDVQTAESQAAASPASVLAALRAGNERFVSGTTVERDLLAQAAATADGQFPLAAILGCIDSRVPVEAVFDQGIGDVFVARSAGNVVDDDVIGGFEFATALAGAKAIVVVGHAACGAVKGACDGAELGHPTQLLAKITPAVDEVVADGTNPGSGDPSFVAEVIERNVVN